MRPDAKTRDKGPPATPFGSGPNPKLSIVIPAYRSADCLEALIDAIAAALDKSCPDYEVIIVNDCSPDGLWRIIERICQARDNVTGVDLRRNFGQDNAILTGLGLAKGQYVAIMDDDLQHDPRDLPLLLAALEQDYDVVYAKFRRKRQKYWKNMGSWFNGRMAEWVLQKPRNLYLSPYKVIRGELVELVCAHAGAEPYVDGLLLQLTSRITQVDVEHRERYSGAGNYTFWKSILLWARVAFSFSVRPLRLMTVLGFLCSTSGLVAAIGVIMYRLMYPENFGTAAAGWASLMVAMLFLSGIQIMFFGILGEYAGRTYLRVNGQPQTSVRAVIGQRQARNAGVAGDRSSARHGVGS